MTYLLVIFCIILLVICHRKNLRELIYALFRLVHRPVDDTTLANVISQMEKEKAKQNTLEAMAQKSDAEDPEIEAVTSLQFNSDNEKVESPGLGSEVDDRRESMDIQETAGQESHLERSTQNDINATQHMGALADEQTRSNHNEGQSSLEQIRRMNIPGLEIITPDDFYDLSPEEQQVRKKTFFIWNVVLKKSKRYLSLVDARAANINSSPYLTHGMLKAEPVSCCHFLSHFRYVFSAKQLQIGQGHVFMQQEGYAGVDIELYG